MMPVGVPKVCYTRPGQRKGEWIDLWEAYQYEKIVYITNPITEDVANQMTALALYLDSRDKKRIYWWINSPGGDVTATLALHDTMQYLRCKSATVGYGMCLGMSGLLLATGEKGYRFAWPNTILMMHHPSGVARGQATDMHNEMKELVRQRDYLTLIASHATGQPYDKVLRDMSRNKWMDPKEAVEYGMIDHVLYGPRAKKVEKALTGPAFKFAREGEDEIF